MSFPGFHVNTIQKVTIFVEESSAFKRTQNLCYMCTNRGKNNRCGQLQFQYVIGTI